MHDSKPRKASNTVTRMFFTGDRHIGGWPIAGSFELGCGEQAWHGVGGSPDGHLIQCGPLGEVGVHEADGLEEVAVLG